MGVQKLRVGLQGGFAGGGARGGLAQEQFRSSALPPGFQLPRLFNCILSVNRTDGDRGSQKERTRPHMYLAPDELGIYFITNPRIYLRIGCYDCVVVAGKAPGGGKSLQHAQGHIL